MYAAGWHGKTQSESERVRRGRSGGTRARAPAVYHTSKQAMPPTVQSIQSGARRIFSNLSAGHSLMLRSVIPDLRSLSRIEIALLMLFGCTVVVFNILDFNSLVYSSANPKVKFESDAELGLQLWRRALMTLSGAASFTGAMCVVLTSHQRLSSFFWGIINCVLYGLYCFAYGYAGDSQLNIVFFLPLQYIGIVQWMDEMRQSKETSVATVKIRSLTWHGRAAYLVLAFAIAVAFYFEIPHFAAALTGYYFFEGLAVPHRLDAVNNGLSIVAQILLTLRYWDSWLVWITINCIQISMFSGVSTAAAADFNIVLMLCLFLINSLFGCYKWFLSAHSLSYSPISKSQDTRQTGLVIGKFYPFHRGHAHLVNTALQGCEHLHIILCYKDTEMPPVNIREVAIRELYPQATLHTLLDKYDQDDSKLWAQLTVDTLGFTPDIVFTSEAYGEPYCNYLGCEHCLVDLDRSAVGTSGSSVRSNPLLSWQYITDPLKPYYAMRFVLVGAESTGKTTLARSLADYYDTVWVEEVGRQVTEELIAEKEKRRQACLTVDTEGITMMEMGGGASVETVDWQSSDFVRIARAQNKLELTRSRACNGILICDTDSFATTIWHERYMGWRSGEVELAVRELSRDTDVSSRHYLLLRTEGAPFVQDGTRDGESLRGWMEGRFEEELVARGLPFTVIGGDYESRFAQAKAVVDTYRAGQGLA